MQFSYFKLLAVLLLGGVIFVAHANFAKAEILLPDGAGFYGDWQDMGGGGAGIFDEVNDWSTPDDDASYNKNPSATFKQSYSLTNTNKTQGTVTKVRVWVRAKAVGTADSINIFLRISGNDYFSSNIPVTTSYADYYYDWTLNPFNSSNWVIGDLNSLESGFQLVGGGSEHRVTQIYTQIEYDTEIQTVKYHVTQKTLPLGSGSTVNDQFSFYVADDLDEVKSAYIEIKGLSLPINPLTLDVSVDDTGAPNPTGSPRIKSYTIDATGRIMPFKFNYDTTDYFKTFATGPGDYSRYFNLKITGNTVYVLNSKLVLTYSRIKPPPVVGAYRQFGVLTSSAFDTGSADGAAYNSIIWNGSKPAGTRIKLQLATSDNVAGPFNFIGGSSCASGDYWEPSVNVAQEIKCFSQLNNKRYFRYKLRLESNPPSYDQTPRVDDIVVNFSP